MQIKNYICLFLFKLSKYKINFLKVGLNVESWRRFLFLNLYPPQLRPCSWVVSGRMPNYNSGTTMWMTNAVDKRRVLFFVFTIVLKSDLILDCD